MRKVLCDCLGMVERKIKNGTVTIGDVRAMFDALNSGVGIDASVKEIAGYYGKSEVNVRSVIKRKLISKPKRKVYYNFSELCRKVPNSWRVIHSDKDD